MYKISLNSILMNSFKSKFICLAIFVVLNYISSADGCYITNCPWGGKRSLRDSPVGNLDNSRQCHTCAEGLGMCFGPRICCGPDIGCLIDSKESLVCRNEDAKFSKPCTPYGNTCEALEFGRCATNNLCCNPDYCVPDSSCSESLESESDDSSNDKKELDQKLLKAISKLLEKKQRFSLDEQKKQAESSD